MDKDKLQKLRRIMQGVPDWLLSIACLAVVLWLTLAPDPLGEMEVPLFEGADKVVHGMMFFGLTLCMLFDAKRACDWRMMRLPMIGGITLLGMGIGIGIEFLQPAVGRSFEFWDMGADAFGAVLAGALWTLADGGVTIAKEDKKEGIKGRDKRKG